MSEQGKQRVYETSDREDPQWATEMRWRAASRDPITVVRHGRLYRARTELGVRPGSPHRSMFVSGYSIVVAWGFSEKSAARRCADKRRRRHESDEMIWRERQQRTSLVNEGDL